MNSTHDVRAGTRRFAGRVVMITGGGAGIGRHYAFRFADEGATLVITDLDGALSQKVAAELREQGADAVSATVDVTDADQAAVAVDAATRRFGGVDVLVNNAGIHLEHAQLPFTLDAVADWRRVLDVNVLGALTCALACRPAMSGRTGAAALNHSSMAAYSANGAYGVSKLALNSLTLSLAAEFADDGIRVNGIAPGLVDSESAVAWMEDPVRLGVQDQLVSGQLIRRPGRMADLASAALFLCSADSSFVTGQTLLVDGGFTRRV
ncbi:SDR family NAD(P)-dependent oxidoreductase [uncultured Jatrophihabitans sp.]|uniref:SDR family NAD(P)-dependent oxidoreductase n=1 Tax=uncultured Jatrophihabitans sp. TaxID=1610747 RepID=UPI0035CABE3F